MKLSKKKLNRIRNTKNQSKRKYKKMKRKKIRSRQRRLNLKKRTLKKTVMSGGAWLDKLKSFFSKVPLVTPEEQKENALRQLNYARGRISDLIKEKEEKENQMNVELKNIRQNLRSNAESGIGKNDLKQKNLLLKIQKLKQQIIMEINQKERLEKVLVSVNRVNENDKHMEVRILAQEAIADMQQLQLDLLRKQKKGPTLFEKVKVKVAEKIQKIKKNVLKLQDKPCDEECKEKKKNSSISYQIVTSFFERDNDGNVVLDKKTKKPKILAPGYLMQYVILNSGMSAATAITTASRAMAVKTNKSSGDKQNVLTTTIVPSAIDASKTMGPFEETDTSNATSPFEEMDTSTTVLPFKKKGPVKSINPMDASTAAPPTNLFKKMGPMDASTAAPPINPFKKTGPMKKKTKKGNKSRKKLKKGTNQSRKLKPNKIISRNDAFARAQPRKRGKKKNKGRKAAFDLTHV